MSVSLRNEWQSKGGVDKLFLRFMINDQEKEEKMGRTRIILRQGLTEEEIERTFTEIGRELTRLGIPEGKREGETIIIKTAIPEEERNRFFCLPRVKDVIVKN